MKTQYLRFGDLPPTGRSFNKITGIIEPGVGVYEAHLDHAGAYRLYLTAMTTHHWKAIVLELNEMYGRPCYLVVGDQVPGGSSTGEILLTNVNIVSPVNPCIGPLWRVERPVKIQQADLDQELGIYSPPSPDHPPAWERP